MNLKTTITIIFTGCGSLCSRLVFAQSSGFVQQDVIKIEGVTSDAQINTLSLTQKQITRTYVDGGGRTIQTVAVQASPLQNDIIQPIVYDNLGRQTIAYLPYAGKSTDAMGSFRPNAISTEQPAFYGNGVADKVADDASPFSQQLFESSPLQRVLSSGMPGNGFQPGVAGNHFKTASYRYNNATADGNILAWNVDGTFTAGNFYADNKLSVTDGKDEAGIETLVFADMAGHTMLKRQLLTGGNLDTYYIYNNAGLVSYIIPPKATILLSANSYNLSIAPLSNLVFKYVYDDRGRLIEKTVPSSGTLYMVYDPLNRPVLTQDARMLATNQWNYIKYDVKGHPISQGIYTDNTITPTSHIGRANMQAYVNTITAYSTAWYESRTTTAATGYYTNTIFPTTNITPLGYSYYDDYDIDSNGTANYTFSSAQLTGVSVTTDPIKGVPTMVQTRTIGSGLSDIWLLKVMFYDKRGRLVQTQSNNHLGNYVAGTVTDYATSAVSFVGTPTQSKVIKVSGTTTTPVTVTVQTAYTYDHMQRITAIDQQYNGSVGIRVAAYTYNELGQLVDKKLGSNNGGTTYLQSVDYRYNIRGQLLSINNSKLNNDSGTANTNDDTNDVFGMQLLYDNVDSNVGNTAYYNGKLSAVKWMSRDASGNQGNERSYLYLYDAFDRYRAANYGERLPASTGAFTTNSNAYSESSITYDEGGNIQTLNRNAYLSSPGTIVAVDHLGYFYRTDNPNQLNSVTDNIGSNYVNYGFQNLTGTTTGTYSYDQNGNMTADPFKGLTIAYNLINKTDKITITTATGRYINYTYNAGSLIKKQVYDNNVLANTMDYVDGFIYVNGLLNYFGMPEGRIRNTGSGSTVTLKSEYIITDQQGNARVSFEDNGSGVAVVRQENSYYGFGLSLPSSAVATPNTDNKQLYNGGSEQQSDFGVGTLPNLQQTFYRNYDAALGRWIATDPMPESAESMSVYQYAGNNPIMMNDPLGDLLRANDGGDSGGGNHGSEFDSLILGLNMKDAAWVAAGGGGGLPNYSAAWKAIFANYGFKVDNGVLVPIAPDDRPNSNKTIDYYYNSSGRLISTSVYDGGDGGIHFYSATVTGTDHGKAKYVVNAEVSELDVHYWQGEQMATNFRNSLSDAWNSPLARAIVPDDISLNLNMTFALGVGVGFAGSGHLLTRGRDAGFHIAGSVSYRVGWEAGASASISDGWFVGDPRKATFESILGRGYDGSGNFLIYAASAWESTSTNSPLTPTWTGYSFGVGPGLGGSAGVSNTIGQ